MDLVALNIQRGRDHGLPGYNKFREVCGITRAKTFEELGDTIPYQVTPSITCHTLFTRSVLAIVT